MSFLEHLDELRKRILNSCIAIAVGVVVTLLLHRADLRLHPRADAARRCRRGSQADLHAAGRGVLALHHGRAHLPASSSPRRSSCIRSGCSSRRACTRTRRGSPIPFVLLTTLGFVGGAAFNHYIAFPLHDGVLRELQLARPGVHAAAAATSSGSTRRCCSATGLIFQMPTVVFFLARMKLVTARFLIKQFKYAVLIIFIVAAVITPDGDPMAPGASSPRRCWACTASAS